jgi:hypothetical protein
MEDWLTGLAVQYTLAGCHGLLHKGHLRVCGSFRKGREGGAEVHGSAPCDGHTAADALLITLNFSIHCDCKHNAAEAALTWLADHSESVPTFCCRAQAHLGEQDMRMLMLIKLSVVHGVCWHGLTYVCCCCCCCAGGHAALLAQCAGGTPRQPQRGATADTGERSAVEYGILSMPGDWFIIMLSTSSHSRSMRHLHVGGAGCRNACASRSERCGGVTIAATNSSSVVSHVRTGWDWWHREPANGVPAQLWSKDHVSASHFAC